MGAGKKTKPARRKKRISKHVLKSRQDETTDATTDATSTPSTPSTPSTTSTRPKTKDPSEAKSYLSLWKIDKSSWKFNKNTQSWLIRHMYSINHVDKETFGIMCEYLKGMKGQSVRERLVEDARRRALRYKDWEKKKKQEGDKDDNEEGTTTGEEEKESAAVPSSATTENDTEEGKQWLSLDDHEKRREYKRARRVIDTFRALL